MRIFGFKAQQISAMEMVGKLVHQSFKTFLRSKKLIFAAGHGSNALGCVLSHGLAGHLHEAKYVKVPAGGISARIPLARKVSIAVDAVGKMPANTLRCCSH